MRPRLKLKQDQIAPLEQAITNKKRSYAEISKLQAILLLDSNIDYETIRRTTGFSSRHCFFLRKKYLDDGLEALLDKRKGNPTTYLTKVQFQEIFETIRTKTPKDLGYSRDFWTTALLSHYIEKTYNVRYKSPVSYRRFFKKLPLLFTSQEWSTETTILKK